jgi:hypothetical protein
MADTLMVGRSTFHPIPAKVRNPGEVLTMLRYDSHPDDSRLGDLMGSGLLEQLQRKNLGDGTAKVDFLCCCGSRHSLTLQTLRRRLISGRSFYLPPLSSHEGGDKDKMPYNEEEARVTDLQPFFSLQSKNESYPFVCPHIQNILKEAYPAAFSVWSNLRGSVVKAVQAAQNPVVQWRWFRRDLGFFFFLQDVGLPDHEHQILSRKVQRGIFVKEQFTWVEPGQAPLKRAYNLHTGLPARAQANLMQRFRSLHHRARTNNYDLHFTDVEQFIQALQPLPKGFNDDPRKWRIHFSEPTRRGYGPDNFEWRQNEAYTQEYGTSIAPERVKPVTNCTQLHDMLRPESPEDFLNKLALLFRQLDTLNSSDLLCPEPAWVSTEVGIRPDVMETIIKKVQEAEPE